MEVGRAGEDDAAAVAALWTEAYTDDPRGGRRTPYAPEDFRSTALAGEVLVVRDGAVLAGVALYIAGARSEMVASGGEAELSRLAVAEQYRRRGIGRALVESCLDLAADSHASGLVLWSRPHQIEAHQLYLSLSFHRAPDRDSEDAEGGRLVFIHRL